MRPFSQQILTALPMVAAVMLLMLFSVVPVRIGEVSLVPNVAWVMTLVVAAFYPHSWPRGAAFALGLLQDVLFDTPLGSQALLTLLLVQMVRLQAARQQYQLFRVRWLEAAGVLLLLHVLLWGIINFVMPETALLKPLLIQGMVSALWFPLFYFPLMLGKRS